MTRRGIVYIAREAQGRFTAYWDAQDPPEHLEDGPGWSEVEEAIAWGRDRSARVLVRMGDGEDTIYSAGEEALSPKADGSTDPYPRWSSD
jgi:hypothetical protein